MLFLAGSLAALWLAATRVVSPVAPAGLDRLLATAATVATVAGIEALVLGRIGLGTDPVALAAASLALWGLARSALPRPSLPLGRELARTWGEASVAGRTAVGLGLGVAVAVAAYFLLEPTVDPDSVFYHLPEVSAWIESGRPGTVELISAAYPIGEYPSTNELLMAWVGGLSQNVGAVLLWPVAMASLLAIAVVSALRALGCRADVTVAAAAAVLLVPLVAGAVGSLDSDLASAAWVAACVALCASVAARRSPPELLAFAILALGLALGTKTSVVVVGVLALALALFASPRLPSNRYVLIALGGAVAVGGVWYLRNLIEHGSPLWPFVELPFGDPIPAGIDSLSTTFVSRPLATLDGRVGLYLDELGAAVLVLAAAIVLPLLSSDRRLLIGAAFVLLGVGLWSIAPATGETPGAGEPFFTVTGVRYLISTVLLAVIVVALVARRTDPIGVAARVILGVAVVWGLVELASARAGTPPLLVLLAGAAAGALAGRLLPASLVLRRATSVAGVAALALVVSLAAYPGIYLDRYGQRADEGDPIQPPVVIGILASWFEDQVDYRDGTAPVRFSTAIVGPLSGGTFAHDVGLIPAGTACAEVRADAAGGWVVVSVGPDEGSTSVAGCFDGAEPALEVEIVPGNALEVYEVTSER